MTRKDHYHQNLSCLLLLLFNDGYYLEEQELGETLIREVQEKQLFLLKFSNAYLYKQYRNAFLLHLEKRRFCYNLLY